MRILICTSSYNEWSSPNYPVQKDKKKTANLLSAAFNDNHEAAQSPLVTIRQKYNPW